MNPRNDSIKQCSTIFAIFSFASHSTTWTFCVRVIIDKTSSLYLFENCPRTPICSSFIHSLRGFAIFHQSLYIFLHLCLRRSFSHLSKSTRKRHVLRNVSSCVCLSILDLFNEWRNTENMTSNLFHFIFMCYVLFCCCFWLLW